MRSFLLLPCEVIDIMMKPHQLGNGTLMGQWDNGTMGNRVFRIPDAATVEH
jgi:hypothetical protein